MKDVGHVFLPAFVGDCLLLSIVKRDPTLSMVKYGQKSKVRTVLNTSCSQLLKTVLTSDFGLCFTSSD